MRPMPVSILEGSLLICGVSLPPPGSVPMPAAHPQGILLCFSLRPGLNILVFRMGLVP